MSVTIICFVKMKLFCLCKQEAHLLTYILLSLTYSMVRHLDLNIAQLFTMCA